MRVAHEDSLVLTHAHRLATVSTNTHAPAWQTQADKVRAAKQAAVDAKEAEAEVGRLERQAKEAVKAAKQAKEDAAKAKGVACEERFGGKLLCIRPLDSGY